MKTYLLLPHIRIHNANAMGSPYIIGFPPMTAWLGAAHALQRKLKNDYPDFRVEQLGISCHSFDLQVYRSEGDRYNSLIGTANPLKKSRKTGEYERPPFIEEARCHLEISLLLEVQGVSPENEQIVCQAVYDRLLTMKMAGGDIEGIGAKNRSRWQVFYVPDDDQAEQRKVLHTLMPGYVLIERRGLLCQRQKADIPDLLGTMPTQLDLFQVNSDVYDPLSMMLQHLSVTYSYDGTTWQGKRKEKGWLVPISVGFRSITALGNVQEQRDSDTLHCFAESVMTLGEFKMPYRFGNVAEIMWHYEYLSEQGLYLCRNENNDGRNIDG